MALPFPRTAGSDILASNYNTALTGLKARIEAEQTRRASGQGTTFTYTSNFAAGDFHTTYNWVIPANTDTLTIAYCISGGGGGGGKGHYLLGGFPCWTSPTAGTGAAFINKVVPNTLWAPGETLQIKVGRRGHRGWGYYFPYGGSTGSPDGLTCGVTCGLDGTSSEVTNSTRATPWVIAEGGCGGPGHGYGVWNFGTPPHPCCPEVEAALLPGRLARGGRADNTFDSYAIAEIGAGTNGTNGEPFVAQGNYAFYPRRNIAGLAGGYENYGFAGGNGDPCVIHADPSGDGLVRITYTTLYPSTLTNITAGTDHTKTIFDAYKQAINNLNINSIALGALNTLTINIGTIISAADITAMDAAVTALEAEVL